VDEARHYRNEDPVAAAAGLESRGTGLAAVLSGLDAAGCAP
jgi:hypothetical protein